VMASTQAPSVKPGVDIVNTCKGPVAYAMPSLEDSKVVRE